VKATPEVRPAGPRRAVTLLPLVAATYFMVSGGPFGLEDLVADAGYGLTLAILVVTPLVWSLPTALAVGELAAAFPEDGGYYAWVKRALGPFWGVQEAWLSLAASFFDLAIYPTLFARYLAQLWPAAADPFVALSLGIGMIAACTWLNLRGSETTTRASTLLGVLLLLPFVVLVFHAYAGPVRDAAPAEPAREGGGLFAALAVAMWNYMGWDNASTIAGEVRDPGRTYPRTMLATVGLVALWYVVPVLAVAHTGLRPSEWTPGTWALAGERIGGHRLAVAIALAGMISSAGMLGTLVMSYSRLPLVLAEDGYLPRWLARKSPATGAPTLALVACAVAYSACLGLGFKRLVQLDVVLYGASLSLEFVALVVLRVREPSVERPFRVPGGVPGTVLVGVVPMALLAASLTQARAQAGEADGELVSLALALVLVLLGPLIYVVRRRPPALTPP
jgi:amino acid transporter